MAGDPAYLSAATPEYYPAAYALDYAWGTALAFRRSSNDSWAMGLGNAQVGLQSVFVNPLP